MEDEQLSEAARRRASQYARQPSLWIPSSPDPTARQFSTWRSTQILRTVVTAALLLGGPPWLLWIVFGNPVAVWSSWWNAGPFVASTGASPAAGMRVLLIWVGWLVWAALAILLVGSVAGVLRGRRLARWRLPMPLHRLIIGLTGTATVAVVAAPTAAAVAVAPRAHSVTASAPEQATSREVLGSASAPSLPVQGNAGTADTQPVHDGRITLAVGRDRYEHHVRRGDTLSKIARMWLHDADRWPDICKLNKHRHVAHGQTMTDCDLIYPGWTVRLPADAVPPADATPSQPPAAPHRSAPPVPARPESTSPPVATPDPAAGSSDAEGPRSPGSAPPTTSSADDDTSHPRTGGELVLPGGSIIPWTLAAAITATAALVWLQRRRRYVPGSPDQLQDLPAPVLAAQHHTGHASAPALREQDAETLPSGGVGLIGSGADSAARGLIITALTAGTPTEPAQHAEVIIDRPTVIELLRDPPIVGWQRLHITDTLEQSLTLLDTHLLRRARILDEHDLTDLDTLRETALAEEALPPLFLITESKQAIGSTRARITLGLTQGLDITTVVLGHWPHGPTLSVSDDGDTQSHTSADHAMRLAVLDIATTRDFLDATREAHTGQVPSPNMRTPTSTGTATGTGTGTGTTVPLSVAASRNDKASVDQTPPVTSVTAKRARLRVLGEPGIEDITAAGRPLRAKALELAVYLAVHPDGASTRQIGEYLEPDARISQADQRVHTNASNLRHVLGRAGTADTRNSYLIKSAGRYRLDPATVDVDLWALRDLLRQANIAPQPRRRELLTAACNLCTKPLADGRDYEWIQPHRETVRRWSTEAHLMLADDLLDRDPRAASDLLDEAIGLDRYNEALYIKAMQARHALKNADGIRTLLRALTKALTELNAEPREGTIKLAHRLSISLTNT